VGRGAAASAAKVAVDGKRCLNQAGGGYLGDSEFVTRMRCQGVLCHQLIGNLTRELMPSAEP